MSQDGEAARWQVTRLPYREIGEDSSRGKERGICGSDHCEGKAKTAEFGMYSCLFEIFVCKNAYGDLCSLGPMLQK